MLKQITIFVLFVLALFNVMAAQVQTGTPSFASLGGGPFDTINLGNLNVHFDFPIFSRPGRGVSFGYALKYDNSIWYPTGTSPNMSWIPISNYGWNTQTDGLLGYLSYSVTFSIHMCGTTGGTKYSNFRY